jgi:RNA polymerase sigma-70 factor (ECF subfamily)
LFSLKQQTDQNLIKLSIKGNKSAYEAIVLRYQKLVYNVVFQLVKSKETANDVTQETFIKAYKALPTFRENLALRPWLLRIATNSSLNALRGAKSVESLDYLLEDSPGAEPVSKTNLESEVENRILKEQLNQALNELKPIHRHIFLLRYQHDLSYEEISAVLEEPVSTVKSLLFRVRNKVRLLITNEIAENIN